MSTPSNAEIVATLRRLLLELIYDRNASRNSAVRNARSIYDEVAALVALPGVDIGVAQFDDDDACNGTGCFNVTCNRCSEHDANTLLDEILLAIAIDRRITTASAADVARMDVAFECVKLIVAHPTTDVNRMNVANSDLKITSFFDGGVQECPLARKIGQLLLDRSDFDVNRISIDESSTFAALIAHPSFDARTTTQCALLAQLMGDGRVDDVKQLLRHPTVNPNCAPTTGERPFDVLWRGDQFEDAATDYLRMMRALIAHADFNAADLRVDVTIDDDDTRPNWCLAKAILQCDGFDVHNMTVTREPSDDDDVEWGDDDLGGDYGSWGAYPPEADGYWSD